MNKVSDAIAAFIIAILSGMGVGSGGLLMIWLTEVTNYSPSEARSINLLFFLFSASSALLVCIKRRQFKFKYIFLSAILGIIGSVIGTYIGMNVSNEVLRKIFGYMLIFTGTYSFISVISKKKRKSNTRFVKSP